MENEYIHLISQPGDLKADFTVKLAKKFYFTEASETFVGLRDISFPTALNTQKVAPKSSLDKDKLRLAISIPFLTGDRFVELDIPTGYYDAASLCREINNLMKAVLGPRFESRTCFLLFNSVTKKIEFILNGAAEEERHRVSLLIFASMSKYLGLQKEAPYGNFLFGSDTKLLPGVKSHHIQHGYASFTPYLKGFELIFVYLDIVKYQCTGHAFTQLLDIIPRSKCANSEAYYSYRITNPKYIKLHENLRFLQNITVKLSNENGDTLDFGGIGETRLSLHFLSKKNLPDGNI